MKEHPILFRTPMVQAILEGRKSQTRRICKPQPVYDEDSGYVFIGNVMFDIHDGWDIPMYLKDIARWEMGDHLWVRETFLETVSTDDRIHYEYRADYSETMAGSVCWKPLIYMPREASRITLPVTDIRVERLQDITEEDAIAEGIDVFNNPCAAFGSHGKYYDYSQKHRTHTVADKLLNTAKESYKTLWESINGKGSWEKNPWVWVIKFERIEKQENETK